MQNAAIEGNSEKAGENGGLGGAQGWKAAEILESTVTIFVLMVK